MYNIITPPPGGRGHEEGSDIMTAKKISIDVLGMT